MDFKTGISMTYGQIKLGFLQTCGLSVDSLETDNSMGMRREHTHKHCDYINLIFLEISDS